MKANLYIGGETTGGIDSFHRRPSGAEKAKDLDFDNNLDSNSKKPRLLSRSKITKDLNLTSKGKRK